MHDEQHIKIKKGEIDKTNQTTVKQHSYSDAVKRGSQTTPSSFTPGFNNSSLPRSPKHKPLSPQHKKASPLVNGEPDDDKDLRRPQGAEIRKPKPKPKRHYFQ